HAIAEFVQSLNHAQRRNLRCRPRPGTRRQCDVPSERTFRRLLKAVDAESLKDVLVQWMAQQDPRPVTVLHLDGKVVKNAQPAPANAQQTTTPPPPTRAQTHRRPASSPRRPGALGWPRGAAAVGVGGRPPTGPRGGGGRPPPRRPNQEPQLKTPRGDKIPPP